MANHPQQQFGQGLGNGGDGPPNERQHANPQRGHYAESLRPIVVRDHQKSADGVRFGEHQEPGYHVGYQNSSYGAEYGRVPETYRPPGSFANSRHTSDYRHPVQSGPSHRTIERKGTPLRKSSSSQGSHRDRMRTRARPAREAPSRESASERLAKILAQRKAESSARSAPKAQPPTPPTPAQVAQGQVQPDLERRFQDQEQRFQAAMTMTQQQAAIIVAMQQEHDQLRREHDTLVDQLNEAARNGAFPAFAPAPRAHIETAAEPLRPNISQSSQGHAGEYHSIHMLSSQEAGSLQSAPGIGQQMAPSGFGNGLTPTESQISSLQSYLKGTLPKGDFGQPPGREN
ncbi:uncharacterized protein J4E88_009772 [Alternaria novae-zelandiae]|uniref:uncharacterized protein n=1 Tax=Alternaria novae-zelandiae TaxID=430562 RepID=UPI0020C211EF|nr:uncharacterized protein J4E88_009772 [Alternaria novae-zelandiae]KAI4670680.1 hypothetical protein J4E88_009772 [Alternaria novae-zelandiae]